MEGYWIHILCGGVTGVGCGGFLGGLCANQYNIINLLHKKTSLKEVYLFKLLVEYANRVHIKICIKIAAGSISNHLDLKDQLFGLA